MFRLNPLLGFWAGTTIVNQFSPVASTSLATSLWKTPPNVTKLQIEAWGAGGQSGLSTNGEGGGGGGAYAVHSDFDTVADEVFRFTIGDGGGNFQDGGESYVDRDLTTLLLHCEGVDGATTTEDDSGFKQSVTFQGNAEIDTAQFKFGTSSILFGGVSTDYIEIAIEPELEPISDQFTCEAWVRFASVDNTAIFFSQNQTDDVAWSLDIIVGDLLRLRYTDPVTGLDANIVILDTPGGTWNPHHGRLVSRRCRPRLYRYCAGLRGWCGDCFGFSPRLLGFLSASTHGRRARRVDGRDQVHLGQSLVRRRLHP